MITPKHTPGPWHIGKRAATPAIYGPRGEEVALMLEFFNPDEENEANARLIAKAPELREVLEEMIDCHKVNPALWDKARAILAKIHP